MEDYELVKQIGAGGFGEVWLAKDSRRNEAVAVKFLKLDDRQQQALGLFKREFEILSEIRHVHLARVFDFGYWPDRDTYFFTEEFSSGRSLMKAIEGKPESYFEEIFVQILSALDYIHAQGIIHFDIKPENVFVTDKDGSPHVMLLDFGIAARLKSLSGGVGGTISYMAPEVLEADPKMDHRVDLYSLGMLSLLALTGRFPFDETDPEGAMEWHLHGELPLSIWDGTTVPSYLKEIVAKLLKKIPAERFSSARVVLNFLNLATGRRYLKVESDLKGQIPAEGPLVERRETALAEILKGLEECLSSTEGGPRVCMVAGERGIGKSRLLDEVRRAVELKEISFFDVVCDYQTPVWSKLAKWLGVAVSDTDALDENWQANKRLDALLQSCKEQPLCLFLDDFEKADREIRRLVETLSVMSNSDPSRARGKRLFILAATEEAGAEQKEGTVVPARLSPQGVQEYVGLVLGITPRNAELAQKLYHYSGGLPLLMVEGLRYMAPRVLRGETAEIPLPPRDLSLLYQEKIQSLVSDERDFLFTMALMSRSVEIAEVQRILRRSPEEAALLAEKCSRQGLLYFDAKNGRMFVSSEALARDLVRSLDPGLKEGLHRRIVDGLEGMPAASDQEIAYHLSKAGRKAEASARYRKAAEIFKSQAQISRASDCLRQAMILTDKASPLWNEIAMEEVRLLVTSGALREAEECLKNLGGDGPETHEVRGWLAAKQRRFGEARDEYDQALQRLETSQILKRVQIENGIANVDLQERRVEEAVARFRQSLDLEASLTVEEAARIGNNNLGLALSLAGDYAGAIDFYLRRLQSRPEMPVTEEISYLNGLGYVSLHASRYEEAIAYLSRAVELAEKTGAMHSLFASMGNLITSLIKEGLYAESLPYLERLGDYQERLGTPRDLAYNLLRQGDVYLTLGIAEAAMECFDRGRKIAEEAGQPALVAWFLMMDGYWEREFGRYDQAQKYFLETEVAARKVGDLNLASWAVYAMADAAFEAGDYALSQKEMERIDFCNADEEFEARVRLLMAKILTSGKIFPDMRSVFSSIEAVCKKNQFREILWEVYQAWADAEDRAGRLTEAIDLLQKGVEVVEAIAASLPEEYRDRYIRQKGRIRLMEEWKMSATPTQRTHKGFLARMKRALQKLHPHAH